jgi:hypothetical protein
MKDVETGEIDYDELRAQAIEHKPKIILAGFSAYSPRARLRKVCRHRQRGWAPMPWPTLPTLRGLLPAACTKTLLTLALT